MLIDLIKELTFSFSKTERMFLFNTTKAGLAFNTFEPPGAYVYDNNN
jgi:hypothetical protein